MTREIKLLPASMRGVEGAFWWYERQRKGLGHDFLLAFEATVESLRRLPEGHELVALSTRKVPLRRFPYLVLYALEESRIVVTAVFHARRDPRRWSARVREEGGSVVYTRFVHRLEKDPQVPARADGERASLRPGRGVRFEDAEV